MIKPLKPQNEESRIARLREYAVLDTPDEVAFDEIVELAKILTGAEIAVVSLVDEDRQWFKAKVGLNATETPRDISFCGHAIHEVDVMVVPDALEDARFHDNPLVTSGPKIRFYAGAQLRVPSGEVIGTLCVINSVPRALSSTEKTGLQSLAKMVVTLLELKKAERAAHENEALLDSFFQSSDSLMGVVDVTDKDILHLYGNEAFCKFFGTTPEAIFGKYASEIGVPSEVSALWIENYRRSRDLKKSVRFEYAHKTAESERTLEATVNFIRDIDPVVSRYSFLVEDVTEQKKAQREILVEKEKLAMIASNIGDVIWMTDPNKHEMLFISPAYEKIWEQSCKSLYESPKTFLDAIHPDDRSRVLEQMSFQGQGVYSETYRLLMPDGRIKWILDRSFPIRGEGGSTSQVVGLASDITERVNAQEIIEAQKVSILQSSRLSAVGEMAAGVAHEINNPLAIIRGTTQLLLKEVDYGSIDRSLIKNSAEKIDATVIRIAKIIKGLRMFARDGKADPKAPASIRDIVGESLEFCKSRFESAGVVLAVNLPAKDVRVECRSVQIAQVLLNLLNNAFDAASGENEPKVMIDLEETASHVLLSVSDNGPPIPAAVRARMMEPFFTTKGPGKGTGLGLSISRGILTQHGGELILDPDSQWTKMVVKLPRV